jgi:hypothetical protein
MKSHHTVRAEAAETAVAVQEAPAVNKLVFASAGLGAMLSAVMLFLGADNPATTTMGLFVAMPLIPALCAAAVWIPLSLTQRTGRTEARRQTITAAGLMFILAIIFFFIDWSARFELSLYFGVMLFSWGSRLQFKPLKWAALPFVAVAIALRVLDIPGEGYILALLGILTVAWAFLPRTGRRTTAP